MSATASPSHSNPASRPTTPGSLPQDSKTKGKIGLLLSILRRFLGVTDLASVRFSLPAQLMEPIPNLEYWNYLDYPDAFVQMGDSNDDIERCISVLKFWFTKDLCHWDVKPEQSGRAVDQKPTRVCFLTEQTSHHPPISAFYVECKEKGISAKGYDQISAKFTGTSIKVAPGGHNLGIFINIHDSNSNTDEVWNLTHPAAHLGGFLSGALSITVQDICYITCPKRKLKVILHYLDEPWVGRSKYKVEGVIFTYDPENDTIIRIRDVPEKDIKARIDGSWISELYYTLAGAKEKNLIVDVKPLSVAEKFVPEEKDQLDNESRKMWQKVTDAIVAAEYDLATDLKVEIEDQKRKEAAERTAENKEWEPRYFVVGDEPGIPTLKNQGRDILDNMSEGIYAIPEPKPSS
ncbi:hypothetical protein H072_6090 [Dactylellina haptotyla CBS 200.50]|uniref:Oxysterol-binding protein n=1 Tax=Dactylellina haptotyla (strain CBS 200.50) TaxID=1284197 RepID=S8BL55_DACHA|nr:hypothetical protein H072_6090 [Dactylellina haptotyla CBS 200.50]